MMEPDILLDMIELVMQNDWEELSFPSAGISTLPESIGQLTNLTSLDLRDNQLVSLPESIGQLTNLTSLDLRDNQLVSLPESIGQLTRLKSLLLSGNPITNLPDSVSQLDKFTSLNLSFTGLQEVPKWIADLTNLTSLDLSNNYLTSLPESIVQLRNLISLDLSSNCFEEFPDQIARLKSLTSLNIRSNKFGGLPDQICELSSLTFFNLSHCSLIALPVSMGNLKNLISLDISYNKLEDLPKSIVDLKMINSFALQGNPLSSLPPEIRRQDGLAILSYYCQLIEGQTDYIYEAKLLLIGEGGAGKTTLANKLIDVKYELKLENSQTPEESTEGIDVLSFSFEHFSGNPLRINIWDFGGQEIYHATHQFFLTKRSLYVLVADTRQDNTDFNYWLEVVELLSDASPTLIVKNEKQDRQCQVNEGQLRGRFPNLEKVLTTNLLTNRGLPEILMAVQHHISQLPHIGQPLPKTWV
ncbi:leucine-rich repeat domain-containing protein, partial [filamentous cyanobacterium LEGE 11480]